MNRIVLATCTIALSTLLGCSRPASQPKKLTSPNGRLEIMLPARWQPWDPTGVTSSPAVGKIFARCDATTSFVDVISEAKEDFARTKTIDEYAQTILGIELSKAKLADRTISEPKKLKINGFDALQFEVRGTLKNVKIVYHKTFLESPTRWNQIMCWTTPSHWEEAKTDFDAIDESFRERPQGAK